MPNAFHAHIRQSLANPNLQAALDLNAEKRIIARQTAFISLPEDLAIMRQRARAVRAEVIANLDHYLEQFIGRAQANGIVVHRAAYAAQAVQIALEIAWASPYLSLRERKGNSKGAGEVLVVKSKSMVSEEIELNRALEAAGLRVVETDLGEYIVQLRGEKPAHIIAPAVHLRRGEVGQTFHEKLGIPLTDDIPTLTAVARAVLRQAFLDAEIGFSGVNFGVAETGTLCLITNEGNGRMATTLPPVHIALMGMERLVPTLDDLALMLYLLPRSSTGQKLSVYTSLIHSPRRADDADGARERHVIILDNGRSAVSHSPLAEALFCIRCGACLNACPVFREIGGHAYVSTQGEGSPYTGPIGSVISAGLFGQAEFGQLARASSLCGACKEACPVDIDLPKLLLRVRGGMTPVAQISNSRHAFTDNSPPLLRWGLSVFGWFALSPRRFAIAQQMAGILSRVVSPFNAWMRLPAFTGWGYSKDFPRPAARPFRKRFGTKRGDDGARRQESEGTRVQESGEATGREGSQSFGGTAEQFEKEFTPLGGIFIPCAESELSARILDLLREKGIGEVFAWHDAHLPCGLLESLAASGVRISYDPDPSIRVGLTGALAGIAESGTLVLPGGKGRPLTASLLPEVHFVVLRAKDILAHLPEVFRLSEVRESAAAVLITGPSRTADIEMTLTIGVHGPREVYVFCI